MYYTSNMQFDKLADKSLLDKTIEGLRAKGYEVSVVTSKEEALSKIKSIIPDGKSVMNGASVTLEQIGYVDYVANSKHKWNNLHKAVTAESDPIKRAALRKQSVTSDFYLGSVHALIVNGEFLVASNTGSQLPHIVSTSANLIFVVSTKKIVADFNTAMERLEKHVVPLEDKHMQELYGINTSLNKIVIFKNESPITKRQIKFILIEENLGF